jgi:hypothetical protein
MTTLIQITAEALAEKAEDGPPPLIDHRKHKNPYWSLYGKAKWKAAVESSGRMRTIVNIRVLVTHMVNCGIDDYRGTIYEDCWGLYHDALSLMTSQANQEWMEAMGYRKYWILPQFDLNTHFKYYRIPSPTGNHAESMPWDSTSNKDHDDIVMRHVAATYGLANNDPRKFSLRTPKDVSSAYRRIYNNPPVVRDGKEIIPLGEGGPPPHRLGHDIMKVPKYWRRVFNNEGLNVQGNVKGHRGDELREARKAGKVKGTHGGTRVKKTMDEALDEWLHPDAREAMDLFFKKEESKYAVVLQRLHEEHGEMTLPKQLEMDMVDIVDDTLGSGIPPPSNNSQSDSGDSSACSVDSEDEEDEEK